MTDYDMLVSKAIKVRLNASEKKKLSELSKARIAKLQEDSFIKGLDYEWEMRVEKK